MKDSNSKRYGHRPIFPKTFFEKRLDRRLAIVEEGMVRELNGLVHHFQNPQELADILNKNNLLSYIESFTEDWFYEYIDCFVRSPHAEVMANRLGEVSSVRLKFSRTTRWIILSSAWGEHATLELLYRLDRLFHYCDVGVATTPSALGFAIMRKIWKDEKLGFHTSPSVAACEYIWEHQIGGRVDTPGLNQFFDAAIEYDRALAYLSEYEIEPTATAIRYEREPLDRYFTWFGKCIVTIKHELALGPFPIRRKDGRVVYPTLPGKYECYLWKEQAERVYRAGCEISCQGGYGWLECTLDTVPLCQRLYSLKVQAPEEYIESYMKSVIVATIGRNGMKDTFSRLVHYTDASPEDVPVVTRDGLVTNYCIHTEKSSTAVCMPHWFNYTIQMVAVDTYDFALPFAERCELIATNYDSVLVLSHTPIPNTVKRYSAEQYMAGTWRWELLSQIYIPAPRSIISLEKTRLPGVKIDHQRVY